MHFAAGDEITDECANYVNIHGDLLPGDVVVTMAGKLPCSKIFHAVGPQWQSDEPTGSSPRPEDRQLGSCVWKSLEIADKKGYRSLAMPAISAGSYGYPLHLCTHTIVSTIHTYFASNSKSAIKEVRLIGVQNDVVQAFTVAIRDVFGADNLQLYEDTQPNEDQG